MPSRRRFLASAALATGLAGCTGGESGDPNGTTATETTTGETTETTATTARETQTTTDETTTEETPTFEPQKETPESDVVQWRVAYDAPISLSPVAGDGAVYVALGEVEHYQSEEPQSTGALSALEIADGTPRWTTELPAPPLGGPYFHDGSAYCVSGGSSGFWGIDNRLHRFASDGIERWRTSPVNQFLDVLAFGDGRAYLGTNDDALAFDGQRTFAVGLSDGRQRWSVETGDAFDGRYVSETLLVAPGGGQAVANHDPRTGERRWQRKLEPLGSESEQFTVADDALFVTGSPEGEGGFAAIELGDGSERWRYAEGGGTAFVPTGAAVAGDTVVGTEYGGRVFGLSVADGSERWTFDAAGATRQPPVVADRTVYIRGYRKDEDDVIHALDAATGSEQWRTTVPGFVTWIHPTGESVVVKGGDRGGTIRALDSADGAVQWSFETYENLFTPAVVGKTVLVASERGIVRAIRG